MSRLWLLLNTIFIVLFNTIFFISTGFSHSAPIWIAYAFIHVAYAAVLVSPSLTPNTKSRMVLGLTLDGLSLTYFILELVIGVAIICTSPEGWKFSFIVQFFLFCAYLFILTANMIANKHTVKKEKQSLEELTYHKAICSKISSLLNLPISSETRKNIEKLYDNACSSQTKSHKNVTDLEGKILAQINFLEETITKISNDEVVAGVNNISTLLSKREQELRLLN